MKEKKKNMNSKENVEYDSGNRSLFLSKRLNADFDDIKNFGNFKNAFFHNYFHSFYSLAVAFAAYKLSKNNDYDFTKNNFEETDLRGGEKGVNSIDSEQLKHHDDLFKTIAYWYLLKKGDPEPYKVLCQTNKARQICEGFFIEYWKEFREKIRRFSTSYPNVELISLIDEICDSIINST